MTITRGILRVALGVVAIGGLSVTVSAIPTDRPGVQARRWVHSLRQTDRSFYLRDSVLRSLPSEYRQALLGSIPKGAARSAFWQAALATYRDTHTLAAVQVAALNRAIMLATPETMDGSTRSAPAWKTLEAGLQAAFGQAGTAELMYQSRTDVGSAQLPSGERLSYEWRRLQSRVAGITGLLAAGLEPSCNCYLDQDCGSPNDWYCDWYDDLCPPGSCSVGYCDGYCIPIG